MSNEPKKDAYSQVRIKAETRDKLESIRKVRGWNFIEAVDRIIDDYVSRGMKDITRKAS